MELPPIAALRPLIEHYAEVLDALDLTAEEQPLVLPTAEWFPDVFTADDESLSRLVARMQGYAGLEAVDIEARVTGDASDEACGTGGCGSGGCAPKPQAEAPRLLQHDGQFSIEMPRAALGHSIAFTASIARMLGSVRLVTSGMREVEPGAAELAAVALGFGVLLLEASHLYSKGCGGPSIGRATLLSPAELAVPFALFVACEGHKLRKASNELSVTQRELVEEAWALVQSNPRLVEQLKRSPAKVSSGNYTLGEARSWLARVFGQRKPRDREAAALEALERGDSLDEVAALLGEGAVSPRSPSRSNPADDDLRQLVDEALERRSV
jgi:hypothetical protein